MVDRDIFFYMMEVEVAAPDPPQHQQVPAAPYLPLALTANVSLSAVLYPESPNASTALGYTGS
jgi:hypothetical protein